MKKRGFNMAQFVQWLDTMPVRKRTVVCACILLLTSCTWGTSYALMKEATQTLPTFSLLAARFLLSVVLLAGLYIKKLPSITRSCVKRGSVVGLLLIAMYVLSTIGIQMTTASKQTFLIGSNVLMLPFIIWVIFRVKPDIYTLLGAGMAAAGIGLLTIQPGIAFNNGDLLSLSCAVFCAFHILTIDRWCKAEDPVLLTLMQFTVAALVFILVAAMLEKTTFQMYWQVKWELLYLAAMGTVLAFVGQITAQRYISATSAAIILSMESVFGSLFAAFYLGETMSPQMVVGCVIILAAIITKETRWSFLRRTPDQGQTC